MSRESCNTANFLEIKNAFVLSTIIGWWSDDDTQFMSVQLFLMFAWIWPYVQFGKHGSIYSLKIYASQAYHYNTSR